MNSTNRWAFYFGHDVVPKLPSHWSAGRTTFTRARQSFASVAHLWLAQFDETGPGLTPFPREGAPRRPPPPRKRDHFERVFLPRAKSYYFLAQELGIYGERPGTIPAEKVWQLRDDIGLCHLPDFDSPDLLVPDFCADYYLEQYEPRSKRY